MKDILYTTSLILSNTIIWIFLLALFSSYVLRRLFYYIFNKEKKKSLGILFWLNIILLILCIILLIIIFDLEKIFSYFNLIFFFITFILLLLSYQFKKTLGLIFLLILILIITSIFFFYRSVKFFSGKREVCKIRILSIENNIMKIEYNFPENKKIKTIEMVGEYFAPIIKMIILDDYLVFLGLKTAYRFIGFNSFSILSNGIPIQKNILTTDKPSGIPEYIYNFIENNERFIPGVRSAQINLTLKKAVPMIYYKVIIYDNGKLEITEK